MQDNSLQLQKLCALMGWVIFLLILLVGGLGYMGYLAYSTLDATASDRDNLKLALVQASAVNDMLAETSGSMLTDYQKNAYENDEVDTIMQQQLLATETAIGGLQVIAMQNHAIIRCLTAYAAPPESVEY